MVGLNMFLCRIITEFDNLYVFYITIFDESDIQKIDLQFQKYLRKFLLENISFQNIIVPRVWILKWVFFVVHRQNSNIVYEYCTSSAQ